MDISYFREFVVLAETKNFWATSERLFIGQSFLSKHIKTMEKALGAPLFERTSRKVELTEFGKFMLPYAQSIAKHQYEYETAAFNYLHQGTEILHIASIPAMAHYGITDILLRFQADFPTVQVHTAEADTLEIREWLIERKCELAFYRNSVAYLEHDPDKEAKLVNLPYCQDKLVAVLPKNHPLTGSDHVELAQLSNEHFALIQNGTMPHSLCMRVCREAGFTPWVIFTSHSPEALLDMVSKGDCVALLFAGLVDFPRAFLHDKENSAPPLPFAVVPITPEIPTTICLGYLKGEKLSTAAAHFAEYCMIYGKTIPNEKG